MQDIVIVGAGGFGRETAALIRDIDLQDERWNFLGFIDDGKTGTTAEGWPILGDLEHLLRMEPKPAVTIAIANAAIRERIATRLKEAGFQFPTLVHPTVAVGPNVTIGEGCILCRGGMLTTNVTIGDFVISNLNCTYGHDTVVEDYNSLMSHTAIAGDVRIGRAYYFGLHCTVINLVDITGGCTFGAGSVVVRDVTEAGTYVGVPARRVK